MFCVRPFDKLRVNGLGEGALPNSRRMILLLGLYVRRGLSARPWRTRRGGVFRERSMSLEETVYYRADAGVDLVWAVAYEGAVAEAFQQVEVAVGRGLGYLAA